MVFSKQKNARHNSLFGGVSVFVERREGEGEDKAEKQTTHLDEEGRELWGIRPGNRGEGIGNLCDSGQYLGVF